MDFLFKGKIQFEKHDDVVMKDLNAAYSFNVKYARCDNSGEKGF